MTQARATAGLHAALLAYQRAPGQYAVGQREPAQLFACLRDVLQLAAGRSAQGLAIANEEALKRAACFFIRRAMFYPAADHYTLLGLPRSADAATIKEHYRLLMRLMHPDFVATGAHARPQWPDDAAARLNLAYQVLSVESTRARYNEQTEPHPLPHHRPALAGHRPGAVRHRASRGKAGADPRTLLKMLAGGFGVAGATALLAVVVATGGDEDHLVQRAPEPGAAPARGLSLIAFDSPMATAAAVPELIASAAAAGTFPMATPAAMPPGVSEARSIEPLATPASAADPRAAVLSAPPLPAALVAPLVASLVERPSAPAAVSAPAPAPAVATSTPPVPAAPTASVTLPEAHPLLARLLQLLESGVGDRILGLLDAQARGAPAAQALVRHYNALVNGARPVKVAGVQLKGEPRDGRLWVTGIVTMQLGEPPELAHTRELAIQAEFDLREGKVVMTALRRADGAN